MEAVAAQAPPRAANLLWSRDGAPPEQHLCDLPATAKPVLVTESETDQRAA